MNVCRRVESARETRGALVGVAADEPRHAVAELVEQTAVSAAYVEQRGRRELLDEPYHAAEVREVLEAPHQDAVHARGAEPIEMRQVVVGKLVFRCLVGRSSHSVGPPPALPSVASPSERASRGRVLPSQAPNTRSHQVSSAFGVRFSNSENAAASSPAAVAANRVSSGATPRARRALAAPAEPSAMAAANTRPRRWSRANSRQPIPQIPSASRDKSKNCTEMAVATPPATP